MVGRAQVDRAPCPSATLAATDGSSAGGQSRTIGRSVPPMRAWTRSAASGWDQHVRFERGRPLGASPSSHAVYPIHARTSSACSVAVAHRLQEPFGLERRRLRGPECGEPSGEGLDHRAVREREPRAWSLVHPPPRAIGRHAGPVAVDRGPGHVGTLGDGIDGGTGRSPARPRSRWSPRTRLHGCGRSVAPFRPWPWRENRTRPLHSATHPLHCSIGPLGRVELRPRSAVPPPVPRGRDG